MSKSKVTSDDSGAKRCGRPATGTLVKTRDGRWQALIPLTDGTRKRWPKGGFPAGTSEAYAREKAAYWTEQARANGLRRKSKAEPIEALAVPAVDPDEMDRWVEAWIDDRGRRGHTCRSTDSGHYRNYIRPVLHAKHVRHWTPRDMRTVVAYLDAKAQAEVITPKSASNVWITTKAICRDACSSKVEGLRVRSDNPSAGVKGPDKGPEKEKKFLYPSEFLQLVSCAAVPLDFRRAVTLACFTYTRLGELEVLRWSDVDLEHGTIHVHRAVDRHTGEVKETKGRKARKVPIHPNLLP